MTLFQMVLTISNTVLRLIQDYLKLLYIKLETLNNNVAINQSEKRIVLLKRINIIENSV